MALICAGWQAPSSAPLVPPAWQLREFVLVPLLFSQCNMCFLGATAFAKAAQTKRLSDSWTDQRKTRSPPCCGWLWN